MTAKDQAKLLNAGFTIIRKEEQYKGNQQFVRIIKAKTQQRREWHTMEKDFNSTAALNRRVEELLAHTMIIED